jgi:hypothetical protein
MDVGIMNTYISRLCPLAFVVIVLSACGGGGGGGDSGSLALTLNGTYTGNALGSDYSIRVMDGGSTLGTASLGANAATWSLTTGTLTAGSHDFKAVVVRNSDSIGGSASSLYTVKLGNSVGATSGSNILDTITLTLSKKDWRLPTQTDVAQQVKGFPKLYFPNLTWFWIESDTPTYGWYVEAYSTVQAEVGPFTYGSDDANDVAPVILVRNSR